MVTLDVNQEKVYVQFKQLHEDLSKYQGTRSRWRKPPKGIYCYGSVGRGKTLLMDLFFNNLSRTDKCRLHFHAFMRQIHTQLHAKSGEPDPLRSIAQDFAQQFKVLCLDEMMVDDVADAMILARLFEALFSNGVVLILTSNTAPENLYRNGVQRQNFLPAIKMIQENTHVISIGDGVDYRIKTLLEEGLFFTPLTPENNTRIAREFEQLTNGVFERNKVLMINDRPFTSLACSVHIAWFSFAELCEKPRAYPDYLALAQQFNTIFITDMPVCYAKDDSAIRRFVHLIDVLYDAKIILVFSAAASIYDLYQGHDLKTEFTRTQSRLMEMRTLYEAHPFQAPL